eukprot:7774474-Pyramimonas_sp.AAC.1
MFSALCGRLRKGGGRVAGLAVRGGDIAGVLPGGRRLHDGYMEVTWRCYLEADGYMTVTRRLHGGVTWRPTVT